MEAGLRTRLILLALMILGVLLNVWTVYISDHLDNPTRKPANAMLVIYMLVVPVVLWVVKGERSMRILLLVEWVGSILLLSIGFYLISVH